MRKSSLGFIDPRQCERLPIPGLVRPLARSGSSLAKRLAADQRRSQFTFHSIKIPCLEGQIIPKNFLLWVQEHLEVHLLRCIEHYFIYVDRRVVVPEKVYEAFLAHELETSHKKPIPRYKQYDPGKRSYAWLIMFHFSKWIHEVYPSPEEKEFSGLVIPDPPEDEEE